MVNIVGPDRINNLMGLADGFGAATDGADDNVMDGGLAGGGACGQRAGYCRRRIPDADVLSAGTGSSAAVADFKVKSSGNIVAMR